jgi:hypothetical protein
VQCLNLSTFDTAAREKERIIGPMRRGPMSASGSKTSFGSRPAALPCYSPPAVLPLREPAHSTLHGVVFAILCPGYFATVDFAGLEIASAISGGGSGGFGATRMRDLFSNTAQRGPCAPALVAEHS